MKKVSFLIFFSIIIIIGSLLFFRSKGSFSSIDSGITRITAPIGVIFSSSASGLSSFFGNLGNIGNIQRENKSLREKINRLEAEKAKMSQLVKENEALRKDLNFKNDSGYETVMARVSFFDPTNVRASIVVNKGVKDGLYSGMVATSEGILVGKVTDVYDRTAKIILITDPFSSIPSITQTFGIAGLTQGQVGTGLIMSQIPQEVILKKGENVVTSGLGGDYPKGLILGRIENITKKNNSMFQSASLRPLVDFNSLEWIQLIKEK